MMTAASSIYASRSNSAAPGQMLMITEAWSYAWWSPSLLLAVAWFVPELMW
jgi:hypothetical protein